MNYYLKYTVGKINFATPIEEIREIARPKEIAEEKLAKNIDGFFRLRETKVLLYNLSQFLQLETEERFEVIITEIEDKYIGLKVGRVFGIVEAEDLRPLPEIVRPKNYFRGVIKDGENFLQVISLAKLLSGPRLRAIKKYL